MDEKLPKHVAIIMDGNGRWALQRGLSRVEGHLAGVEAAKLVVRACLEKHIEVLSLFAFSCENWLRPKSEVDFLMNLFIRALESEIAALHSHGVKLRFIGDCSLLPTDLHTEIEKAEVLTAHNDKLLLNVCVNYSGRWDIVQATKTLCTQVVNGTLAIEAIDEATFAGALGTAEVLDPDLLIRTSGEWRISNFFLWQFAYTELYFSEVLWPDFAKDEFDRALKSFSIRERRYGQISEQLGGSA